MAEKNKTKKTTRLSTSCVWQFKSVHAFFSQVTSTLCREVVALGWETDSEVPEFGAFSSEHVLYSSRLVWFLECESLCNTNNPSDINWLYAVGTHTTSVSASASIWPPYKLIIRVEDLSSWLCIYCMCVVPVTVQCAWAGAFTDWEYVQHKFFSHCPNVLRLKVSNCTSKCTPRFYDDTRIIWCIFLMKPCNITVTH